MLFECHFCLSTILDVHLVNDFMPQYDLYEYKFVYCEGSELLKHAVFMLWRTIEYTHVKENEGT